LFHVFIISEKNRLGCDTFCRIFPRNIRHKGSIPTFIISYNVRTRACFKNSDIFIQTNTQKSPAFLREAFLQAAGRAVGAYLLPQFEQLEELRLVAPDFLTLELLQSLQFVCFIALPPTSIMCGRRGHYSVRKDFQTIERGIGAEPFAYNKNMKRINKQDGSPVDKMIQGNKEEAENLLSLWGMKPRKHIKPNNKKK